MRKIISLLTLCSLLLFGISYYQSQKCKIKQKFTMLISLCFGNSIILSCFFINIQYTLCSTHSDLNLLVTNYVFPHSRPYICFVMILTKINIKRLILNGVNNKKCQRQKNMASQIHVFNKIGSRFLKFCLLSIFNM